MNKSSNFSIVFTPMHGVGKEWVSYAFESFDLPPYLPVNHDFILN